MIEYRPAMISDLEAIRPTSVFSTEPRLKERKYKSVERGDAWVITRHGSPVVLITLSSPWPGNYAVHALVDEQIEDCALSVTRATRHLLQHLSKLNKARRVSVTVRADSEKALRWAQALGFEFEGMLHAYGADGSNYVLMARW